MKIVLHAGTPKTGTTSLQLFLDKNREALLDRGVLYPRAGVLPPPEPKHQWMIGALMSDRAQSFEEMLASALNEVRHDTHTVILSSEGLFHRWWDFTEAGLAALQSLARQFSLEWWVFFRNPASFARSFYIQMLKNPSGSGPCYGQDISLGEMLDNPRFAVHFDYIGYVEAVEAVVGSGRVRPFHYNGNTISSALTRLNLVGFDAPVLHENRTVGVFGVELLRQINRRSLDYQQKMHAVRLVEDLDRLLDGSEHPLQIEPEVIARVEQISSQSLLALREKYQILL